MWIPLGFQQITLADNTTPHSLQLPAAPGGNRVGRMDVVVISVETQNVRYRDDGAAPTSSTGVLLVTGQQPFTYDGNPSAIQFCAVVGGAVLNVSFYRIG